MAPLLEAPPIAETARLLARRVDERFSGSGLSGVARELVAAAEDADRRGEEIARPHRPLRALTWLLGAVLAGGLAWAAASVTWSKGYESASDLLQGVDAAANLVLLLGAAIFGAARLEERMRRQKALRAVHELKALAHVVDMHQLAKRPAGGQPGMPDTPSSPKRSLGIAELVRYLDYCTELLALVGKVAVLYGQRVSDPVVLEAVDDLEELTTGLARKIWQKMAFIEGRKDPPE
jgi:hypothetical protein